MNIIKNQAAKIVRLTPPCRPTKENILGVNVAARPYRKGGIRLEKEVLKDKVFYHNYGHGSAGVTLAPSTCSRIVDMFSKDMGKSVKEVAIVGAGYIGIMQAIKLAHLGYKVNVYANYFPKQIGIYDKEPSIASQVAGGYWMPYGLDIPDKTFHFKIAQESFDVYKNYIDTKKYKGLSFKEMYIINTINPSKEFCPPGLIPSYDVKVDFGNGVLHDAENFRTMLIDADLFMNELFEEAKDKKVNFVKREFKSQENLFELKENVIFNCTGVYSKILFGDDNIIPIAGHMVYLKNTPGVDYFLSTKSKDGKWRVTTYPHHNKLAVGYTWEENSWGQEVNANLIDQIIRNFDEFLEWRAGIKCEPRATYI